MLGYLDEIVDGKHAVILVESEGKEYALDVGKLPVGVKEGTWFDLVVEGDQITELTVNLDKQREMEIKTQDIMGELRKKKGGSRFRRE